MAGCFAVSFSSLPTWKERGTTTTKKNKQNQTTTTNHCYKLLSLSAAKCYETNSLCKFHFMILTGSHHPRGAERQLANTAERTQPGLLFMAIHNLMFQIQSLSHLITLSWYKSKLSLQFPLSVAMLMWQNWGTTSSSTTYEKQDRFLLFHSARCSIYCTQEVLRTRFTLYWHISLPLMYTSWK